MDWQEEVYTTEHGGWVYSVFLNGESVFEAFWPDTFNAEDVLERGRSFFAKQLREALAGNR